jgi:L-ribulose-5-phosphate 3-epimerase
MIMAAPGAVNYGGVKMKKEQLICSTTPYHLFPLERALQGIQAAGMNRIELSAAGGWCEHADPDALGPNAAKILTDLMKKYGMTAVSMSGHMDLASEVGVEGFRKRMRLCNELGIKYINTGSTEVGQDYPPDLEDKFYANIAKLADEAKSLGVTICEETHGALGGSGTEIVAMIKRINHPNVRVNYDPGNVIYYRGLRPEDDLKNVEGYLAHFHIKDKASMTMETWDFPAIGDGIIDWDRIFAELDRQGYTGPASFECELDGHPENAEIVDDIIVRSYQFSQKYFK